MRVSVLDLGSNSFRLLVADTDTDGAIRPVLREREMLHLGGVVATSPTIPHDVIERSAAAVKRLNDLAIRTGATTTIAVATSAIRDAANRTEVLEALGAALDGDIRVLPGTEEARLAFLGVAASVATPAGRHLVLDLGGGSLELAVGDATTVEWSVSVPVGVSRFHSAFVSNDPIDASERAAIKKAVRDALLPLLPEIERRGPTSTVSVGGAVRSIAQIAAHSTIGWQPPTLNQLRLTLDQVDALRDQMLPLTVDQRLAVPGMKESRAGHMSTATVIVSEALRTLGLTETLVSFWGLREGVVLDELGLKTMATGRGLRPIAVTRLAERFAPDLSHADHVTHLADRVFTETAGVHGFGPAEREMLGYAARLHSIGQSIAFRNYPQHSAYLLEHSELRGFSPTELAMLMTLVRSHRRGKAKDGFAPYEGLTSDAADTAKVLAALLHLADNLDRSLDQSVEDLHIDGDGTTLGVELVGDRSHLRRRWAESAVESVERELGVRLVFRDDQLSDEVPAL